MSGFKFELKGADKVLKDLDRVSGKLEVQVKTRLLEFVQDVNEEQVNLAPKVTRTTAKMTFYAPNQQLSLNYTLFCNAEYAAYIEFGTGALVDIPAGLEDYAAQFRGKGIRQVNLPARPFFFPPFFRNIRPLIEQLKKDMKGL